MLNKNQTYAIIGASSNLEKYGYKVLKDLHDAGYKVIPVNPKGGEILGLSVRVSLEKISETIDVVVFITQPKIVEKILPKVHKMGIKKVWFQPGSESEESINFCEQNKIEYIAHACVMIDRKK